MTRAIPCFQVDAFATRPFTGNPAAVCPLSEWLDAATMQRIAAENALSETAFFAPAPPGSGADFELRWFTPGVEVDLCGHATLASAFVLMTELDPARDRVTFASRSGPLHVVRQGDRFTLDFPARPAVAFGDAEATRALAAALGGTPREVLRARDLVAVFDEAEQVRALAPDLAAIERMDTFGVIVTARGTGADADVDFVSRFFAPKEGVPEDPVTGSAHCTLAPLWGERLGRSALRARQVSARGGEIGCALEGERVLLSGQAVLVKSGTFHLPGEGPAIAGIGPGAWAVIFESTRAGADDGYDQTAAAMEARARTREGFLGIESARGADGRGITVSYWSSADAIRRWKADVPHGGAQRAGRERFYSEYRVRVCRVDRAYGMRSRG